MSISVQIVKDEIDLQSLLRGVREPAAGGVDLFVGTTRNNHQGRTVLMLEYVAYEPMALRIMRQIAEEAVGRWQLCGAAIVHRIGRVGVGEASVAIAASAAHRDEAFQGCRFMIDRLKQEVPIWKKEFFEGGEVWVGTQDDQVSPSVQSAAE